MQGIKCAELFRREESIIRQRAEKRRQEAGKEEKIDFFDARMCRKTEKASLAEEIWR